MDSKYLKDLEEEIKQKKAENDFQMNLPKTNKEKEEIENSEIEHSQNQYEQEEEIEQDQEQEVEQEQEQNDLEQSQNNNNNFEEEEDNDIVNEGIKSIVSDENQKIEKNIENIDYDLQELNEPKTNSKFPNLISMNSFSVCQCCNKEFDSKKNIPYLLKCNHFFCKTCLENYFTDEEGIKCPIDGLVGKSLNDIKILTNFMENKNNEKKVNNKISNNKKNLNENNYLKGNNGKNLNNKKKMNKNLNKNKENNLNTNIIKNENNEYEENENDNENNSNINNDNINELKPQISSKRKIQSSSKKSLQKNFSQNNKNDKLSNNNNLSDFNNNISNNNINDRDGEENMDNSPSAEEYNQNFCNIHPEQKITHFVEDTKELICIHCAFNKLKNNPTIQIKEISEKCKEYLNDLDNIIDNNQKYSQIIQNSLNDINENKENEEKKIIEIYEQLLNLLVTNRNNFLIKIEEIYQENTGNMNKKLENFGEIIDIAEKLKEDFEAIADQAPYEFNHLTQAFNKFIREMNDKSKSDLEIMQYNFSHDELNKVLRYLNNFSDVKTRKKCFRFDFLKNNGSQNYAIREINNNNYNNNYMNRNINIIDNNVFNNGINKYYKASKGLSYINFSNSNNNDNNMMNSKMSKMPERNTPLSNSKNNSLFEGSNNNLRFNFKYEENDNRDLNRYNFNNNNFNNNNNYNGNNISESINAALNKYIVPNNNINKDNYNNNKNQFSNFHNSNSLGNNTFNNSETKGNIKENDKLAILNKYKIPGRKNK